MAEQDVWEKRKVCIIEDDQDVRDIYVMKFTKEGFSVSSAENGEIGMKVIREVRPDIILLDVQMPVKDGIEVLRELQADPDTGLAKIPVVMLTNVDDEETIKQIGKFDTRFYLIKSLTTPQKAVDYVREVL